MVSLERSGLRLRCRARQRALPDHAVLDRADVAARGGLNLVEALQTLAEKERRGERQEVLSGILAAIHRGEPFSQAVAALPAAFLAALRRDHQGERAHRQRARGARPLHRLPGRDRPRAQEDRLGEHLPGDPDGRRQPGARRSSCSTSCRASRGCTRTWRAPCRSSRSCCSPSAASSATTRWLLGLAFAGADRRRAVGLVAPGRPRAGSTRSSGACRRSASA